MRSRHTITRCSRRRSRPCCSSRRTRSRPRDRARGGRASRTTSAGSRRWRRSLRARTGVAKAYALQAGREIRVIVEPSEVDDDGAVLLSHEIAREIEDQLEYPGQVKVIVIRESRAIEVAGVDADAAARAWVDVWTRGWAAADADAIATLYAEDAVFYSHPFRDRQEPRAYVEWAFDDQARRRVSLRPTDCLGRPGGHRLVGGAHVDRRLGRVDRRHLSSPFRGGWPRRRTAGCLGTRARPARAAGLGRVVVRKTGIPSGGSGRAKDGRSASGATVQWPA